MRLNGLCRSVAVVLLCCGLDAVGQPAAPDADTTKQAYTGEVIGQDVYVRSGPSSNYYPVTKLHAGTRVRVVGERNAWLTIDPPPGCFSLIHKNFVDIDPDSESGDAVVNGDAVVVRAGSDLSPQLSTKQLKLDRGTTVRVLKPHNADYLRISPPKGVHLYISSTFVQPARTPSPTAGSAAPSSTPGTSSVPDAEGVAPSADASPDSSSEAPEVQADFYRRAIAEADAMLTAAEREPLLHRDFSAVIARFEKLSEQEVDPHARDYARARLAQLHDASETLAMVRRLRSSAEQMTADRKAALQARVRSVPPPPVIGGGFDVIGELRKSMIYGSRAYGARYRLVGDDGVRTIGYVEIPVGSNIDVRRFLGRKVGVRSSEKRLQTEDVDPLMIYVASELVLLDVRRDPEDRSSSETGQSPPSRGGVGGRLAPRGS